MTEDQEDNLDEIRRVYPHFTDEELRRAKETLDRYVRVMCRIYERVLLEQGRDAARKLANGE